MSINDHEEVPPLFPSKDEDVADLPFPPPLDELPLNLYAKYHYGTTPVCLYEKMLEESDLNRFVITTKEKLIEFLTPEENKAVNESEEGLEFYAIDDQALLYTLHFKSCPNNTNEIIIDSNAWNIMILENLVEKTHFVRVWGYRVQTQLRVAFTFD